MNASADLLTLAESEAICRSAGNIAAEAERMALDFGVVVADRDRLRLAHHLAASSLRALLSALAAGDRAGAAELLQPLIRHAETHAYGAAVEVLPAGVTDLDEVRDRRAGGRCR